MEQNTISILVQAYRTPFDSLPENEDYSRQQYEKGLRAARNGDVIHIAISGVWSADHPSGSRTFSYEVLGWHACTAELLRGWLEGGATIIDHRKEDNQRSCRCSACPSVDEKNQDKCCQCRNSSLPFI